MGWCPVPPVVSSVTLGTSLPLHERVPLCAVGAQALQGSGQLERRGGRGGPSMTQALPWPATATNGPHPIGPEGSADLLAGEAAPTSPWVSWTLCTTTLPLPILWERV